MRCDMFSRLTCGTTAMPKREALAATAEDLSHGDGRGRYVKQVYLR